MPGTTVTTITAITIVKAAPRTMRAIVGALVGLAAFSGIALALSPSAPLSTFPTEARAQQHCQGQTVVWLNLPTGVYHYKGQRWYGNTRGGLSCVGAKPTKLAIEPPEIVNKRHLGPRRSYQSRFSCTQMEK
jgi:hypothetical protein